MARARGVIGSTVGVTTAEATIRTNHASRRRQRRSAAGDDARREASEEEGIFEGDPERHDEERQEGQVVRRPRHENDVRAAQVREEVEGWGDRRQKAATVPAAKSSTETGMSTTP